MGNLIKILLFLIICNLTLSEEKGSNNISQQQMEEEVLTGKTLFFNNSNLIRIEVRKDETNRIKTEAKKITEENRDTREERNNIEQKGDDKEEKIREVKKADES